MTAPAAKGGAARAAAEDAVPTAARSAAGPIARYSDLKGRVVFISGGATGIGADMARAFAEQEARVVFVDIDAEAGAALAAEIAETCPAPRFIACDVTDDAALLAALEAAEAEGGVEALVNNAANDTRHDVAEIDADRWRSMVDVNLRHQFVAARAVCGWMKGRGRGSVINFGSVAPTAMIENLAVYSMCKAAVRGLTRSLARDYGPFGVRANTIVPGAVLTARQRALWFSDQASIDRALAGQCLKRELAGRDVAEMALFLASDVSAACTGQDFIVDAGTI